MNNFLSRILELIFPILFWVVRKMPQGMLGFSASFLAFILMPFAGDEFRKIYVNTNRLYGRYPFGKRSSVFAQGG
ncbi:MAG: hypothetical protein U9O82_00130 [Thermodesulfobacteriota bacterium]|nr:hypothetical protein [Thermodesulfobacteriota bacterium]